MFWGCHVAFSIPVLLNRCLSIWIEVIIGLGVEFCFCFCWVGVLLFVFYFFSGLLASVAKGSGDW